MPGPVTSITAVGDPNAARAPRRPRKRLGDDEVLPLREPADILGRSVREPQADDKEHHSGDRVSISSRNCCTCQDTPPFRFGLMVVPDDDEECPPFFVLVPWPTGRS